MTGVSVRKVLTMFVQIKQHSLFFFNLRRGRRAFFLRRAWDL